MGFLDSDSILFVIGILMITGMILISISSLSYGILMITYRNFQFNINAFTINYCLASLVFSTYYICFYAFTYRSDYLTVIIINGCNLLIYFAPSVNCLVVYSSGVISINRLCVILFYNKPIFKTKAWVFACVSSSWIAAILLPLPYLVYDHTLCIRRIVMYWHHVYVLLTIVVMPTILFGLTNIVIFNNVRNSTKRVQTTVGSNETTIQQRLLSRRDVKVLRNMLLIFLIFTIGWAPIYIFRAINTPSSLTNTRIDFGLSLLPVYSLFLNMIILHFINQEFRDRILVKVRQRLEQLVHRRIINQNMVDRRVNIEA